MYLGRGPDACKPYFFLSFKHFLDIRKHQQKRSIFCPQNPLKIYWKMYSNPQKTSETSKNLQKHTEIPKNPKQTDVTFYKVHITIFLLLFNLNLSFSVVNFIFLLRISVTFIILNNLSNIS